jgi:phospholipase C
LASVNWVYSPSGLSEHPPDPVHDGSEWVAQQIKAIVDGGLWPGIAIFITWDDWGGWYDHVKPEQVQTWPTANTSLDPKMRHPEFDGDQFRYGNRVPCLVISPFAKAGISHQRHSHASLVRFCEKTFNLDTVNPRTVADDMSDCFDLTQPPAGAPTYVPAP